MRPFLSPAVWTARARSTSGSFVRGSLTNSSAHMAPIPRASPIRSWPSAISTRRLRIQAPRAGRVHHRRLAGHAAEGQTPADRLAAHEDVGNRAPVLDRPHFPRASGPRLDLVIDE